MIHLPSLAQLDRATGTRIWLCTGPTDMRRGFDRLAEQAKQVTRHDPQSGHRFVFRSRRGDRLRRFTRRWNAPGAKSGRLRNCPRKAAWIEPCAAAPSAVPGHMTYGIYHAPRNGESPSSL